MWEIPKSLSPDIVDFAKKIGCNWIGAVTIQSQSAYEYDDCHNSVHNYISIYSGEHVLGFYFVKGFGDIQAIRHSVVKTDTGLIDVMPYRDNRQYNIFGTASTADSLSNYYYQSLGKYNKQEIDIMYYVYQLVDPRNNQPFYIGKGTGNRAQQHLYTLSREQNKYKQHKIDAIRNDGFEPRVEYIAENIVDASLAYDIETSMIKKLGRKGYENGGILTNVCIDN